ncbi:hypothetical protein BKA70DRAFT_1255589, partial [Coprinopsis sp. MPI-PUGE-AT-0042]
WCIDDKVLGIHLKRWQHTAVFPFLAPSTKRPVPWHRDTSSSGTISLRCAGKESANPQNYEREAKGAEVTTGRTGPFPAPLCTSRWRLSEQLLARSRDRAARMHPCFHAPVCNGS